MSSQRRSGRQRAANTRLGDLPDSSPTQSKSQQASRKRKASTVNAPAPRRARRVKTPEPEPMETEDDEDEGSENEGSDEEEEPQDLVDLILPYLDVAGNAINAADQHANEKVPELYGKKDINAFAKICGRDWTYYVFEPRITFGREPEDARQSLGPGGEAEEKFEVHIDLGPSKTVSRNHAQLYYESSDDRWHFQVLGRNGAKINDSVMRKGDDRAVQSGDVIGIASTQMLFQPASGKAVIHQMFLDRLYENQNADGQGGESKATAEGQNAGQGQIETPETDAFASQANDFEQPYINGQSSIASASTAGPPRPVTPDSSVARAAPSSGKKRSPRNQRGIVMESTEQIDYSLDSSKDLKPGCSYASMITWAILSSPEESLSLNGIYDWIKKNYAYYRLTPSGWQNSIRHNLSLNPSFGKIARRSDEPGKGMKWMLVPEKRQESLEAAKKNVSKAGGRTLSAPGSPAGAQLVSSAFAQGQQPTISIEERNSPQHPLPPGHLPPPPPSAYTSSQSFPPQTSTPPQASGPHLPVYAPTQGPLPALSGETSPLPRHRNSSVRLPAAAGDSSPVLNSYAYNLDLTSNVTPAPRAHNLNVLQPTTAKLPTSHMIESSPAPFWKFPDGFGSTPARPPWEDASPQRPAGKTLNGADSGAGDGNRENGEALQSSSPPPAVNGGLDSPTRKSGGGQSQSQSQSQSQTRSAGRSPTRQEIEAPPRLELNLPKPQTAAPEVEEPDEQIDLTKGFRAISSYHQQRNTVANATGTSNNISLSHSHSPVTSTATATITLGGPRATTRPPSSSSRNRSASVGTNAKLVS